MMIQERSHGKVVVRKSLNKQHKHSGFEMMMWRLLLFVSVFTILLGIFNHYVMGFAWNLDMVCSILLMVNSIYLCYLYRYNVGLFIAMIFIAYANYSIAVGVYLFPEIRPASLYAQFERETFHIGVLCLLIFVTCLVFWAKKLVTNPTRIDLQRSRGIQFKNNRVIALGAFLLYVLMFSLTFNLVLGRRGGGNAITEYRAVILAIGIYYSGNRRGMRYAWTVAVVATSILVFLSGNRIDAIPSIIILMMLCYSQKIDYKKVLVVFPIVVVFMTIIGVLRGASLSEISIRSVLVDLWINKLTWDTAIYAYMPSLSIIDMVVLNMSIDKLEILKNYVIYTFIGSSVGNFEMSTISREYYTHYYGCITPTYFYYWFQYFGVMITTYLVRLYTKWHTTYVFGAENRFSLELKSVLSVYFVSNVGRWYLYGPSALIRNMLIAAVVFTIVYFGNMLMSSNNKRRVNSIVRRR